MFKPQAAGPPIRGRSKRRALASAGDEKSSAGTAAEEAPDAKPEPAVEVKVEAVETESEAKPEDAVSASTEKAGVDSDTTQKDTVK